MASYSKKSRAQNCVELKKKVCQGDEKNYGPDAFRLIALQLADNVRLYQSRKHTEEGVSAQPTEITVHIQQDGAAPDRDVFIDDDSGSGLGIDEASGSGWGPGPGVDDEDGRGSGDGAVRPALSGLPEDDEDFAPRTTAAPGTPAPPPDYPDLPEPDNALPTPTGPEPPIPTPKVQQPDLVSPRILKGQEAGESGGEPRGAGGEQSSRPDVTDINISGEDVGQEIDQVPSGTHIETEARPADTGVFIMNAKPEDRATSFFAQPGILAAVIGGAVVGLLCAILVVMFIVYRMRKKDEGSYALDEPKRSPAAASYGKGHNNREFYA
ncbi:Syndecan [Papilio machaon]|uniref:Syndecan n=1 Tax=Papilio machaon TaxID=76193 RepID=A0A194QVD2_PAPMA|nr:Syndecan [Papilio machaon]